MRSPITALSWDIWRRNRGQICVLAGIPLLACLLNSILIGGFRPIVTPNQGIVALNGMLMAGSFFLSLAIFNYTESNSRTQWSGFPYRLFTLPVATWMLVALPLVLGVVTVEVNYLAWLKLVFSHNEFETPGWMAVLLGVYMILYQAALWILAGFRVLRLLVLSVTGIAFVGIAFVPFSKHEVVPPWSVEKILIPILLGVAALAFLSAWATVTRQRRGGGRRRSWARAAVEAITDVMPRRRGDFASPTAAQFWFEWRRNGLLLPLCLGGLLVLIIGPASWFQRDDPNMAVWILIWTLAMPIILAAAAGKAISAPDVWSRNLSLPTFVAVRPLASGDYVVTKMKVAALSAAISWLIVLAFLSLWLPLWADLKPLAMLRVGFWMVQGHSVFPQYAMAALFMLACAFVTWKVMVSGMWIRLSGSRVMIIGSVTTWILAGIAAAITLAVLLNHDVAFRAWIHHDPNRLLSIFEWSAAVAVMAKFWLAVFSWHRITPARIGKYLLVWSSATLCMVALALLLWMDGALSLWLMAFVDFWPLDPLRLLGLLVLVALLTIPFAQLGLAPSFLARNRHGGRRTEVRR